MRDVSVFLTRAVACLSGFPALTRFELHKRAQRIPPSKGNSTYPTNKKMRRFDRKLLPWGERENKLNFLSPVTRMRGEVVHQTISNADPWFSLALLGTVLSKLARCKFMPISAWHSCANSWGPLQLSWVTLNAWERNRRKSWHTRRRPGTLPTRKLLSYLNTWA